VEYSLRTGDLELDFFGFNRGAIEGILAHQKVRNTRPEEYQAEVSVSLEKETTSYVVIVNGRIDGIYFQRGKVMVDEIKSTARNLESIQKEDYPLHWAQAKVYAYLFSRQNDLKSIDIQLTYVQIETTLTKEFRKSFKFIELENFFEKLLNTYLNWAEKLDKWTEERTKSIHGLEFPYKNFRLGQEKMMAEITKAIQDRATFLLDEHEREDLVSCQQALREDWIRCCRFVPFDTFLLIREEYDRNHPCHSHPGT